MDAAKVGCQAWYRRAHAAAVVRVQEGSATRPIPLYLTMAVHVRKPATLFLVDIRDRFRRTGWVRPIVEWSERFRAL